MSSQVLQPEVGTAAAPDGRPADRWETDWPESVPGSTPRGIRRALRTTPPGLTPLWRRALVGIIGAQLILTVFVAVIVAVQFKVWAPIDEEAHYSYVQQIAEQRALPVLGQTETSLQGLAIFQRIYPRPTTLDPKTIGLGGLNYEGFQPPLYYIVAVPVFDLTSNYNNKIYALRFFDVALLLGSVALAGRLARVVLRDWWMVGWSMTLVFFLLPGVVVRFVTISDMALAVPLAILFVTELWIAWERHSTRRLIIAGALAGLCVLTYLELLIVLPVFAVVLFAEARRRWSNRRLLPLVAAALVPVVLVTPWFLFNEAKYHMLTGGPISIREVTPLINPHHLHYSLSQLPGETVRSILDPTLPAEWAGAFAGRSVLTYLGQLLTVLLLPGALVLLVGLGRRLWSTRAAILGLPWLLNVVELWYIRYGEQWSIYTRYTYPTLPALLILASGSAMSALRNRALAVLVAGGATVALAVMWVYLIGPYAGPYALN